MGWEVRVVWGARDETGRRNWMGWWWFMWRGMRKVFALVCWFVLFC